MDLFTIDFETFYDPATKYSLTSMTAIEYVMDDRFEIILVSCKRNDEDTEWFSGSHDETRDWLLSKGVAEGAACGHNMSEFDALILMRLGIRPRRFICTLQVARMLGIADAAGGSLAKLAEHFGLRNKGNEVHNAMGMRRADFSPGALQRYADYCCLDTDLCYELFKAMEQSVPSAEWAIASLHTSMMVRQPFVLDSALLTDYLAQINADRATIVDRLGLTEADLRSDRRFAELLESLGVEPPIKISKTTGKTTYAFSKSDTDFTDLQDHDDPDVCDLVAARLKIKSNIEQRRTERFLATGKLLKGRICMPLRYCGAHTGRTSGIMKINTQNLSARNREPVLKRSMRAPDGHVVVSADSTQIEPRTLCWVAGQTDMLEKFKLPKKEFDLYRYFGGAHIYHMDPSELSDRQRTIAKSAVIGAGYAMGAPKFKLYVKITSGITITEEEAQQAINGYRTANDKIVALWRQCKQALHLLAQGTGYMTLGAHNNIEVYADVQAIKLPSGRCLYYRGMRAVQDEIGQTSFCYKRRKGRAFVDVYLHPGLLVENIIQAISRDIVMWQACKVDRKYPVAGLVHDEIVSIAPADEAQAALDYSIQSMTSAPSWAAGLPLGCEGGYAATYGDA